MPTSNKNIPKIQQVGRPIRRTYSALSAPIPSAIVPAWPPVEPSRSTGLNGYSSAVQAVTRDHSPKLHSQYP